MGMLLLGLALALVIWVAHKIGFARGLLTEQARQEADRKALRGAPAAAFGAHREERKAWEERIGAEVAWLLDCQRHDKKQSPRSEMLRLLARVEDARERVAVAHEDTRDAINALCPLWGEVVTAERLKLRAEERVNAAARRKSEREQNESELLKLYQDADETRRSG